jgi:tRNA-splicing ligase RtcB
MEPRYRMIETPKGSVPIKAWVRDVPVEPGAIAQLKNLAQLPFVFRWVAAMPDLHVGIGATVGSVIPTQRAIIPAAVGVDIGCGMLAVRTSLEATRLPDSLKGLRTAIERAVPHGRTAGGKARADRGAWGDPPPRVVEAWRTLEPGFKRLGERHPELRKANHVAHLGTLGTGNHFIELCLDQEDQLWVLLHSGSRGIGNKIGTTFIALAKRDMGDALGSLPDRDLAYLREGTKHFDAYLEAVGWAQDFARLNRELMLEAILEALVRSGELPPFQARLEAVNCHHNYVARETHFGTPVWVTRKGAVRAGKGDLGIIPGSMGARSYIVRGRGSQESFESCSHGAGRALSRTAAKQRFTLEDHARATAGVECRKDKGVLDETPGAYKPIQAVMAAQADLVEVVHELRQIVCVKG